MQKIEIVLSGPEEERCAELINDLAGETTRHFNVTRVQGYCGPAPAKKGYGELLVPGFMQYKPAPVRKKQHFFAGRGTKG